MAARKPKAPKYEEVAEWAQADVRRWKERNERMQDYQDAYERVLPPEVERAAQSQRAVFMVNDAPVLLDKFARVLARADIIIEYIGKHPDRQEVWQALENWLRWVTREWTQEWHNGLNPPLQYSKAFSLLQRGWVAAQVRLRPDAGPDEPPISYTLYDPATVYPYRVGRKIVRVTRQWRATLSDLSSEGFIESEDEFSDLSGPEGKVTLTEVYYDGWHMVMASGPDSSRLKDGRWVKKPVRLGYNPWVITVANGASTQNIMGISGTNNEDRSRWVGVGLLEHLLDYYRFKSKLATMHLSTIEGEVNPAVSIKTENRQVVQNFSTLPGSKNQLDPNDEVMLHRFGPNLNDWSAAMNIIEGGLARGGAPAILWGENDNLPSGYLGALLGAGAADVLNTYIEALNLHDSMVYRKSLEIVRDFWDKPLQAYLRTRVDRPAGWLEVTLDDLREEGTYVLVSRNTMSRQERIALAQTATMLVDKRLLDLETARGRNWLGEDDPGLIHQRVLSDMTLMDPQMVKAMIIPSLIFTGKKLESQLYQMLHSGQITQELMAGIMQSFYGAIPGQSGQPGPPGQGPPPQQGPPNPGINGQVMPPAQATGMGQGPSDPMLAQLLGMLNGGAVGGQGYGGIPPQGVVPVQPQGY